MVKKKENAKLNLSPWAAGGGGGVEETRTAAASWRPEVDVLVAAVGRAGDETEGGRARRSTEQGDAGGRRDRRAGRRRGRGRGDARTDADGARRWGGASPENRRWTGRRRGRASPEKSTVKM